MRYSVGHIGRVVVAKLEDDEDVLAALESLTEKEKKETLKKNENP